MSTNSNAVGNHANEVALQNPPSIALNGKIAAHHHISPLQK